MNIAIIGATGLVGREILKIIHKKGLNVNNNIFLYASEKSNGKIIKIKKNKYRVKTLKKRNLKDHYDFALFSAGSGVSKVWVGEFVSRGAVVIDNSSAFRREQDVPLIVPEINFNDVGINKIIANPNCSTIGASLPIYEMSKLYKIKRIIVSTYQAVSGAGMVAIKDLRFKTNNKFAYKIHNNLIPQIDSALNNGYTFEEDKMEFELKKILNNQDLKICATCVRVPVRNCHSESINIEFEEKPDIEKIKELFAVANGIKLCNDLYKNQYPMPILANGKSDVFVGRLRYDTSCKNAINFFISFDNLRKGAALNAVQIMERVMIKNCKNGK